MVELPFLRIAADLLAGHLYAVTGESMVPAFRPGDRLLGGRNDSGGGPISRGDTVIVRDPRDHGRRYLKRIVGLPREEVRLTDGVLLIDGRHLPEPYLEGLPASPGLGDSAWQLGTGEYFLMGDNRVHSADSRDFGPVRLGIVVGKVWFRCWPISRWGAVA